VGLKDLVARPEQAGLFFMAGICLGEIRASGYEQVWHELLLKSY
jgi:hypothetical protein